MPLDYIIVGQGIAGTALAYTLLKRGKKILVVDADLPNTPSKVAAGLFNPITGRNLVKSWLANDMFPYLHNFYRELEKVLDTDFLFPMPIYVPFDSIEKQNTWVSKVGDSRHAPFLGAFHTDIYKETIGNHHGGMEIQGGGFVQTRPLLLAFKHYLEKMGIREEAWLHTDDLTISDDGVIWKGISARRIIFCDGTANASNPLFPEFDYRLAKGEILDIALDGPNFQHIISRGGWIIPLGGQLYRTGANYHRLNDPHPSEHGKKQVLEALEALTNMPYSILGHEAGVRPTTYDRRPFVGLHSQHKSVAVFGGMGSKGTSMAPYLAEHLVAHLEDLAPLFPEIDTKRTNNNHLKP